jgi:hypothetical protein
VACDSTAAWHAWHARQRLAAHFEKWSGRRRLMQDCIDAARRRPEVLETDSRIETGCPFTLSCQEPNSREPDIGVGFDSYSSFGEKKQTAPRNHLHHDPRPTVAVAPLSRVYKAARIPALSSELSEPARALGLCRLPRMWAI